MLLTQKIRIKMEQRFGVKDNGGKIENNELNQIWCIIGVVVYRR